MLDIATMLYDMSERSGKERGIAVHDVLLDFYRREANAEKKLRYLHTQLLNGFLKKSHGADAEEPNAEEAGGIVRSVPLP